MELLLVHSPEKRSSAEELLSSSFMPPSLSMGDSKVTKFFQFLDFLLDSAGNDNCQYQEYYDLMHRCLNQTTSEADIFKWLDKEKLGQFHSDVRNDFLNVLKYASLHEIFIKRCQENGAQYLQVNL